MSLTRVSRPGPSLGSLVSLGALGVLIGLGVALLVGLPRLTGTAPASGAQAVSSRAPLRLSFNVPMDLASVEQGLVLAPAVPVRLAWEGNTLVVTPEESWPIQATIEARLTRGESQRGLPLLGQPRVSFAVGEPRVAFLAGQPANLYAIGLAPGAAAARLTDEPLGVADYAVSPDGQRLAYSAHRAGGGADLRQITLDGSPPTDLVLCPGEACLMPAYSPDGRLLAYERHTLMAGATGEQVPGPATVYVRELAATGAGTQVTDGAANFPHWSPQGYLAFLDPQRSALTVLDLASGQASSMPSSSGEMGTWLPDGSGLIYTELYLPPEPTPDPAAPDEEGEHLDRFYTYLARVTLASNVVENLSGSLTVEDASPSAAPTGAWLAFGRKAVAGGAFAPGRQLWLMRPTGQQAHALTADPVYNHSAFHWNAAGTGLLYMRFNVLDPAVPAEIWRLEIDAGGQVVEPGARYVATGYLPEWLP